MKINQPLKTYFSILVLQLLLWFPSCTNPEKKDKLPNIIVFLVDDMGLMDSSVPFLTDLNGNLVKYPLNEYYRTPHMQELAAQGVRFSNFYAHSVCSPTRASIMTGQNSARHRTTNHIYSEENNRTEFGPSDWNWKGLTKSSVTLPHILKRVGYKTIHIGKGHFGPFNSEGNDPLNLGFDINIAGSSIGQPGSYYGQDSFGLTGGWKERAVKDLEKYHGKDIFLTEALTSEAKAIISETKKEKKPFFLYMSHYAVHAPFQSDKRFADHYINSGKNKKAQAYATLIEGIDKSLGDIVEHVKKLGMGDNTLILFLGDNGSDSPLPDEDGYSSSTPIKGQKGHHWEGGMRVPFIASWVSINGEKTCQEKTPITPNSVQQQMGTIFDISSTILKVANIDFPDGYISDGFELQDQFIGKQNLNRDNIFLNHFPHGDHRTNYFTSLIKADWKVIYHYPVEDEARYELFNLKNDPFEKDNLADKNGKQLKIMIETLQNEMKSKKALYPEKDKKQLKIVIPA